MSVEELKEIVRNVNQVLGEFNRFKISFLNESDIIEFKEYLRIGGREGWKGWFNTIGEPRGRYTYHVYICGFVDGITDLLSRYGGMCDVRVIARHNRKEYWHLHDNGVQVMYNKNAHFRMFLGLLDREQLSGGFLILGSFDFDKEGLGGIRRDAGIITNHVDLLRDSLKYFDKVWNDPIHSQPLSNLTRMGRDPRT